MPTTPVRATDTRFGWSPEAVRRAERATGDLLENGTLMRRASRALAARLAILLRDLTAADEPLVDPSVVVLVGPGNNGGDALFAAAELADAGVAATVVLVADTAHEVGLTAVHAVGLTVLDAAAGGVLEAVLAADVVVDGILGIGAQARDDAPWQHLVEAINPRAAVVAVDVPTPGVRADITVTIGAPKTSLLLDPDAAGQVEVAEIGLPQAALGPAEAYLYPPRLQAVAWPVPGRHDHKYTRGVVGFATGSDAFPGAAVLGTVAAVSAGTGMVRYVGPERPSAAVLSAVPEAVHGDGRVQAWVVGSGIDGPAERAAQSQRYRTALAALHADVPVVVDAGALTWLDREVRPDGAVTVITPHAGELATLLTNFGIDVTRGTVEADPLTWARRAGEETGFTVLLKGGVSVVYDPNDGSACLENRAPAWLATAGTGDVLAGIVGVLLAAGLNPLRAASLAAYVHGRAASEANPGGPVRALDVAQQLSATVASLLTLR